MYYWIQHWYRTLNFTQKIWTVLCLVLGVTTIAMWVTKPLNRPVPSKIPHIVLDCRYCGVDLERQISAQAYIKQKTDQQKFEYSQEKQRLRQQQWDENGRQRWCRSHPMDYACRKQNQ